MNLCVDPPRSPNEELLGIVSLARTIDKARAFNAHTLGEYQYNCPHDQALFDFLGVDARTFAAKAREIPDEQAFLDWVRYSLLAGRSRSDLIRFNEERRRWGPERGSESESYFRELRAQIGLPEVGTWFEIIDVDERRMQEPVTA